MDSQTRDQSSKPRVLIAGGGVAAVEAMLALRELAGERIEVELHAPREDFVYRPLGVGEPFLAAELLKYDLAELAERAGAKFCLDSVVRVDPDIRTVTNHDGDETRYDYLMICAGARMMVAVPGAQTFWGVSDEGGVVETMRRLRERELDRVVFTGPTTSWPMPIYELALLADAELRKLGRREGASLSIVTSEATPLGVFGVEVGERVRELLEEREIDFVAGVHPTKFEDGLLHVSPGESVEADAVISTPRIEGRRLEGIPSDASGFVAVDEFNRAIGLERVYAAGDVTAFPVKQGGLATQQADAAAEAIAAELGVEITPQPFDPVLRATLWTGEEPQFLYGRLAGGFGETSTFSDRARWEHDGKIAGRLLAPFLNSTPGVPHPGTQFGPDELAVTQPV